MTPLQECGLQLLFDEMELELSCTFIFQLLQAIIKVLTLQNHGCHSCLMKQSWNFLSCMLYSPTVAGYHQGSYLTKASLHSLWSSSLWVSPICSYVDGYFCAVLRAIT